MVKYKCERCLEVFDKKTTYEKHLARKNPCPKRKKNSKKSSTVKCEFCENIFSRNDSLVRHLKTCKMKEENNTIKNKSDNTKNSSNMKNGNNINSRDGSKNTINNIENVNFILPFGKDGSDVIDSLTPLEMIKLFITKNNPFEEVLKCVNFDPDRPEHHNVYCSNERSSIAHIFDGIAWTTKNTSDIINQIIDSKEDNLNKILEILRECCSDKIIKKIEDKFKSIDLKNYKDRRNLKKYIKGILYSLRNIVINTRKIFEEQNKNLSLENDDETNDEISFDESTIKLKNGMTLEEASKIHNENMKHFKMRSKLLREQCNYLFEILSSDTNISEREQKKIIHKIKISPDQKDLLLLIRIFSKYYIRSEVLTSKQIDKEITMEEQLLKIIKPKKKKEY